MRARMAAAVILALAAQPVLADNAKPRGGGSSGGSSSSGSRHSSPSTSSSGGGSSSSSSSSSSASSAEERRHPRAGTGRGYRHGGRGYYYYPYYDRYYSGYYPYYGYWGWGYPSYGYGYGYGHGYGHGHAYGYGYGYGYGHRDRYYRDYGSVRVLVDPEDTRVYVDGYYAGVADDFDGIFQRLHVTPGRHEIMLKLEGYRTHRMKIWVPPSDTIKIHHDMGKGVGEDAVEDLAGPADRYADERRDRRGDRDRYSDAEGDDRARRDGDERSPILDRGRGERGELRLSVRPDDASVYVDGAFQGTGRQVRSLDLPPGRHRVEVVRPGFKTYDREIEVADNKPLDLEVELERP